MATYSASVNFNGTGTVAIRDSFNVTSITDNGTGDYTINFTANLATANYVALTTGGRGVASALGYDASGPITADPAITDFRMWTGTTSTLVDLEWTYGIFIEN